MSNTVAGVIASNLGAQTAFIALGLIGVSAVLTVGLAMPETRPRVAADSGLGSPYPHPSEKAG